MKPKALLFDVFGTVVNWRLGITLDITTHFQNHPCNNAPEAIADATRAQYQSSMEPIRSSRRGYVDLDTLHTENLESVADVSLGAWNTRRKKVVGRSLASLAVLPR